MAEFKVGDCIKVVDVPTLPEDNFMNKRYCFVRKIHGDYLEITSYDGLWGTVAKKRCRPIHDFKLSDRVRSMSGKSGVIVGFDGVLGVRVELHNTTEISTFSYDQLERVTTPTPHTKVYATYRKLADYSTDLLGLYSTQEKAEAALKKVADSWWNGIVQGDRTYSYSKELGYAQYRVWSQATNQTAKFWVASIIVDPE